MSRRALRQSDASVTLFPFLAVLICTMGSLIVLLVVVVQQAQSQPATDQAVAEDVTPELSDAAAPLEPAAPPADIAEQLREAELAIEQHQEMEWQAEALRGSREKTLRRVKQQQQELSRMEDHARGLRQRLQELQVDHERIQQAVDSDDTSVSTAAAELAQLSGQIELARAELQQAKEAAKNRRREYALVPYTGQQGTKRRPIYLECLGEEVIFQPEGVKLIPDDFLPPLGPDNALASALRAAREYLLNSGAAKSSADAYPLLVVRPAGAQGYAACRNALRGWDDEFGYELLPSDLALAYPPADAGLKAILQDTIDLARRRQQFLDKTQTANGPVFAVTSRRGGFVAQSGTGTGGGTAAKRGAGAGSGSGDNQQANFGRPPANFGGAPAGMPGQQTGQTPNGKARQPFNGTPAKPGAWSPNGGHATAAGPVSTGLGGSAPAASRDSEFQSSSAGTSSEPSGGSAAAPPSGGGAAAPQAQTGAGGSGGSGSQSQAQSQAGGPGGMSAISATPIAATHGTNWALPNASQGAIGITRPVLITCTGDRLLIHSEVDNAAVDATVDVQTTMNDAVQSFVSTIWKRIEDWGIAGQGVYWKPVLKVRVSADGEGRFDEFVQLLEASGLEIVRRP